MGVSTSPQALAGKFRKTADNLEQAPKNAVMAAAKVAQQTMTAAAAGAGAGGRRGVNVKTGDATSGGYAAAYARWGPNPGWVKIMDSGAKPHFIGPKGAGRGGSLKKQRSIKGSRRGVGMALASLFGSDVGAGAHGAINIPGVGPRAYAYHPGTHGKHFVDIGNAAALPRAAKEMSKRAITEFAKAFT